MHNVYTLLIICMHFICAIWMKIWYCKLPSFWQQCCRVTIMYGHKHGGTNQTHVHHWSTIVMNYYELLLTNYLLSLYVIRKSQSNQRLKTLLHGAINCINTQIKSTKRAIDCSSLQFLVSPHVHKFIAQTSNLSLRCQ